jgi:hypothetical protein
MVAGTVLPCGQRSPNKMIASCGVLYLDRQTKPWTVLACLRSQCAHAVVCAYSWLLPMTSTQRLDTSEPNAAQRGSPPA